MNEASLEEVGELIGGLENYIRNNQLLFYNPYEYQLRFHHAKGEGEFIPVPSDGRKLKLAIVRALMCANQIGKTYSGGREAAYHITGKYPEWWEGHRFTGPTMGMSASTTNETTRDRCQQELFGDPNSDELLGTGAIPKDAIGEVTRKAGVPNAYDSVLVRHYTNGIFDGWSKVFFRAYEQGAKKYMGYRLNWWWGDEEMPADIYSQLLRSILATDGIGFLTFTPEEGITQVVHDFMRDIKPGQALIQATWDDAPHMTPEKQKQKLESFPPHERDMRSRGLPMRGSGLVFPVHDDEISTEPFEIPPWYFRICGVDFGYDHPFAAVWLALDRDTDTVYVYDTYRISNQIPLVHAEAVKRHGDWIPVVWPHDGLQHDKASGKPLADSYRKYGVNMMKNCFSNPPLPGKEEGSGGQGIEVGILEMLTRMQTGRFKVFSHLKDWFDEKDLYYRKDGDIVKLKDDLMSATRYACQSLRFAQTKPVASRQRTMASGLRNW